MKTKSRWIGPRDARVLNCDVKHVTNASARAWTYMTPAVRDIMVEVRTPHGVLSMVTVRVPR